MPMTLDRESAQRLPLLRDTRLLIGADVLVV
jgi:hypothetical protein